MNRFVSMSALAALIALPAAGCRADNKGTSLEGIWEGAISCGGSGGVELVFDVDSADADKEYDARGLISGLVLDGDETDVEVDSIWIQPNASGPQVIEVEPECEAVQVDGAYELPCEGFDELGWDGANTLEATIGNFLESELDCDLTLYRG